MVPITTSSPAVGRPMRQALFVVATGPGTVPDRVEWLRSEMLKTRVAHGYCSRELVADACPYANICEQCDNYVAAPKEFPTRARSSTRRHTQPPRRRPTRVAIRDCTPRASHRQHRRSSPTARRNHARVTNFLLTGTRGPVNGALLRRLDRTPAAAARTARPGNSKKASKTGRKPGTTTHGASFGTRRPKRYLRALPPTASGISPQGH